MSCQLLWLQIGSSGNTTRGLSGRAAFGRHPHDTAPPPIRGRLSLRVPLEPVVRPASVFLSVHAKLASSALFEQGQKLAGGNDLGVLELS